jgi:hypothetical protein
MFKEEYNTQRPPLILKEYGRNIQIMANYLLTIADREKRTQQAKIVVELMKQVIPYQNNQDTYQKLWDDLHIMCNFNLDVDSPYPKPKKELFGKKPEPLPYRNQPPKIKHYGRSIELLIEEIVKIENLEEREAAAIYLARIMKNLYITWNKDLTDDRIILNDLEKLSGYRLNLDKEKIISDGYLSIGGKRKQGYYANNGGLSKNNGGSGKKSKKNSGKKRR